MNPIEEQEHLKLVRLAVTDPIEYQREMQKIAAAKAAEEDYRQRTLAAEKRAKAQAAEDAVAAQRAAEERRVRAESEARHRAARDQDPAALLDEIAGLLNNSLRRDAWGQNTRSDLSTLRQDVTAVMKFLVASREPRA